MRAEEKQVDGPDLQRAEEKESLLDREDKELQQGLANERPIDRERDALLVGTMKSILEKSPVLVRSLGLPPRETQALEMLQDAVSGRHLRMDTFLYAEDRRSMLEQALAVLQPNLTSSRTSVVESLRTEVNELVKDVQDLREHLVSLEDSQEEMYENLYREETVGEAGDTDDKPAASEDDDKARKADKAGKEGSTLSGGPEVKRKDVASTLSDGAEAKRVEATSTLSSGPAVKREDKATQIWENPGLPSWKRPVGDPVGE